MNFLIIGGTGFVGKHLSEFLCKNGHRIISCDLLKKFDMPYLENYKYICVDDCLESAAFDKTDCVVFLAGKRPYSDFSIDDYYYNIDIFEKFIRFSAENNIRNIVFASSKAVYSGNGMPWREKDYHTPSSLYGASKLACEQLGLLFSNKNESAFKALRFAQIIGLGERKGFLINTLIDNAVEKKTQVIYGSGEQRRHYVYIKDVCRAILCAAEKNNVSGVFNIGMKKTVSNIEMAECVNDVFENKGNLIHDYEKAMDAKNDEMSVELAGKVLGFKAEYDLKKTFEDISVDLGKK